MESQILVPTYLTNSAFDSIFLKFIQQIFFFRCVYTANIKGRYQWLKKNQENTRARTPFQFLSV